MDGSVLAEGGWHGSSGAPGVDLHDQGALRVML
jgi:hypothetical protein